MRKQNVSVLIPEELAAILQARGASLNARAAEAVAVALFRREEISSGKAAEILGVSKEAFWRVLDEYKTPRVDISPDELEQDLATVLRVSKRQPV